jgi:ectoine hydroxylase-related dioxygenase (phytanoyl-CoA dioxygenase family)
MPFTRVPESTDRPDAETARDAAGHLAAEGRFEEAVALASHLCRDRADSELEYRMVQWRRQAFANVETSKPRADWPPAYPDPFPETRGLPEIHRGQLSTETIAGGILHHGSLLVRELIDPALAATFIEDIDQAFAGRMAQGELYDDALSTPWYRRIALPADHHVEKSREFVELGFAGIYMADSPRILARYTEMLGRTGIVSMIAGYMGERPCLSAGKTTVRRVPADMKTTSWHQDGAFLGTDIRSINLWLCLSHCGVDASGLDIVPRRLDYLAERGSPGAYFDWDVSPEVANQAAGDIGIASPVFRPGDAMLFDHMMLHRTGLPAGMSRDRYAIEAWMFAPSHYPMEHLPLVI